MAKWERINLGDGQWFNVAKATRWDEDKRFDGHNMISVATGSEWSHEILYRTASGRWILCCWSNWQGTTDSYTVICENDAHKWLIDNGHHDAVPSEVLSGGEL
jgi:hypothetical protein